MLDAIQINGLLNPQATSGKSSSGSISALLSGSSDAEDYVSAMTDILSAAYNIEQPATVTELSDGLKDYIDANVDEDTAAKLLADIDAINDLGSASGTADSIASLLSGNNDNKNSGSVLDLLA